MNPATPISAIIWNCIELILSVSMVIVLLKQAEYMIIRMYNTAISRVALRKLTDHEQKEKEA